MASGLGFQQALFFKESASFNSAEDLSSGTVLVLPVRVNVGFGREVERITTEHIRGSASVQAEEDQLGIINAPGSFECVIPTSGAFSYIEKHLLGKVTTSGPAGTTYTHTNTWNDKLFAGLSFAVNKTGKSYYYHGNQIASCKMTATVGGPVVATVNTIGSAAPTPIALVTPPSLSLLAATPYWLFKHATFKLDTVTEVITAFDIDFTNELMDGADMAYALGSDTRTNLAKMGHSVSGTIRRRHDLDGTSSVQSKFYEKFVSGATAALQITLTHPTDADYTKVINLGHVKFTTGDPKASDRGHIVEEIPFTAFNLDNAASSIVTTDEAATPATATGAYDGTGA